MNRLHRLTVLLVFAVITACATGPGSESSFNYRLLGNRESGLAYAVRFAVEVREAGVRAERLLDIADHYAELGLPEESRAVREFAEEVITAAGEDSGVSPQAVRLARFYLDRGAPERATVLLDTAVARVGGLPTPAARADVLEEVIDLCFEGGDELFDVLRRAIERVFVVEDLPRRVDILTRAAVRYQDRGVRQSANTLIQQAIPAAGNISASWQRASAFAAIARAYRAIEDRDRAERMIQDALEAVRDEQGVPAESAAEFLARLVALGYRPDALSLAEGVERPASRAVVLSRIAETYTSDELRSSAFVLYARAVSAAGSVEDADARAESYLHVAQSYLRFGERQLAVIQAENAVRSLGRSDPAARDIRTMQELADLYLAAEALDNLGAVPALTRSAIDQARIAAYISLSADGRFQDIAHEYLDAARQAREQAEVDAETAAPADRRLALASARLGRLDAAIAELTETRSGSTASELMVAIGYAAMQNGGLSEDQRSRIDDFYRTYRQRQRLG